jgi:PEGA domain-containing protein
MSNPILTLLVTATAVSIVASPLLAGSGNRSMEEHMRIQANLVNDPELARLPAIRIDSLLADVPVDDRLNADQAFRRPFIEALRDGMSWYLAERGLRVVTSGEDLRLSGTIKRYEGSRGWGDWAVDIDLGFKVFRGTERLPSIDLNSFLKYSDDHEVQRQEQPKYAAQGQTVTFLEVIFTRVGMDLCEKLIANLKERDPERASVEPVGSVSAGRGSLSIDSTASNAEVRIDGRLVGTVPLVNLPLPAGEHAIEVRKKGFKPWKEAVQILPDAASRLMVELEPEPAPK